MEYRKCGNSGLKLPVISLGLWHNFGAGDVYSNSEAIFKRAFEMGITYFDAANNYGRPFDGSAEETLGRILKKIFHLMTETEWLLQRKQDTICGKVDHIMMEDLKNI